MSEPFDWEKYGDDSKIRFNEPGDTAVGEIVKIAPTDTQFAKDVPEITLKCEDGVLRTVLVSTWSMRQKMAEEKPQVGDKIRLKFVDTTKVGMGDAKNFTLEVKEPRVSAAAPKQEEAF